MAGYSLSFNHEEAPPLAGGRDEFDFPRLLRVDLPAAPHHRRPQHLRHLRLRPDDPKGHKRVSTDARRRGARGRRPLLPRGDLPGVQGHPQNAARRPRLADRAGQGARPAARPGGNREGGDGGRRRRRDAGAGRRRRLRRDLDPLLRQGPDGARGRRREDARAQDRRLGRGGDGRGGGGGQDGGAAGRGARPAGAGGRQRRQRTRRRRRGREDGPRAACEVRLAGRRLKAPGRRRARAGAHGVGEGAGLGGAIAAIGGAQR